MGNPILRVKARSLEPTEVRRPDFQKLIDDMIETMDEYRGIGLAAPQVHESVRLVLVGVQGEEENDDTEIKVVPLINPVITPLGDELVEGWEGCLSIPEVRGRVLRSPRVSIDALDRRGKPIKLDMEGFPARVAQHETDHLDGVLFIDRMRSFETLTYLDEYAKFWGQAGNREE